MRPADWVKNLVVLVALVTSGKLLDSGALSHAGMAFVVFCIVASGFYCINDALDASGDREHPLKRLRPVASGTIPPASAFRVGAALILIGLLLCGLISRT